MIAVLTRIFGIHNLELGGRYCTGDLFKALQVWKFQTNPRQSFRVAYAGGAQTGPSISSAASKSWRYF